MRRIWILPLLLLLLLVAPAHAMYNVTDYNTKTQFYEVPDGGNILIVSVAVDDLAVPSNTTFIMNAGGTENYYIWLNLTRPYLGSTVRAEGGIELPNGSVVSFDETKLIPAYVFWGTTKCDAIIQWVIEPTEGLLTLPGGFQFLIVPNTLSGNWVTPRDFIYYYIAYSAHYVGFKTAYIESDQEFAQITGWFATLEEFDRIQKGDITVPITTGLSQAASAAWATFLAIVSGIPVIGPVFAQVFELIGMVVSELVWLLDFIIVKNWLGTLILIEFLAISEALIFAQNKSNVKLMRRVAENHVRLYSAVVWIIMFLWDNIILRLISAIGDLVPG